MKKIDIICKCKHKHRDHYYNKSSLYIGCWYCASSGEWCDSYTPDNLLHIENLAKERKLI
jgi:hypothetical protein